MKVTVHKDPEVESLIDLYDGLLTALNYQLPIRSHLDQLAERLLLGHKNRHLGIKFVTDRVFGNKCMDEIFSSEFSLIDARNSVAQDFGYKNWHEVDKLDHIKPDAEFELMVDRLLAGDLDGIREAIASRPELVHQCSSYPHQSTLLHYTGSNGVEGYRQVVPSNLVDILDALLSSGADMSLEAKMYGGSTAEVLMETSKHPHEAGLFEALQKTFRRYRRH